MVIRKTLTHLDASKKRGRPFFYAHTPDGKLIHLQPIAVDRDAAHTTLDFPAKYGQHTRQILAEAGLDAGEIDALASQGVVVVMADGQTGADT